jgi:recombination protein RecA
VQFDIIYGEGISKTGELIELGVKSGVVEKSGAWYAYGPTKIGQGKEAARRFLKENVAVAIEIEEAIRQKAGLIAEEMLAGAEAEED